MVVNHLYVVLGVKIVGFLFEVCVTWVVLVDRALVFEVECCKLAVKVIHFVACEVFGYVSLVVERIAAEHEVCVSFLFNLKFEFLNA